MDELAGEFARLERNMKNFEEIANRIERPISNSNANISVNAGGIGIWIVCTACLVSFSMNMILGYVVMDQSRKIDRLQDCVNVVLQWAPQLKEFVNQTMKSKGE